MRTVGINSYAHNITQDDDNEEFHDAVTLDPSWFNDIQLTITEDEDKISCSSNCFCDAIEPNDLTDDSSSPELTAVKFDV